MNLVSKKSWLIQWLSKTYLVRQKEGRGNGHDERDDTQKDEEPAPALEASHAFHFEYTDSDEALKGVRLITGRDSTSDTYSKGLQRDR